MKKGFKQIKENILKKIKHDKSSKGSIDKPILPLINEINSLDDFVTTSSCSGRISIVKEKEGVTKQRNAWIFKTHSKTSVEELKRISLPDEKCTLKFETVILHIAVSNIEKAIRMLRLAREAGWKKSGIISVKENKVMIECSSTEVLAMPFSQSKKIIANDEVIAEFCNQANEKLERAHQKIRRFLMKIKEKREYLNRV